MKWRRASGTSRLITGITDFKGVLRGIPDGPRVVTVIATLSGM